MATITSYKNNKGKDFYKYQIDAGVNIATGKRKRISKSGFRTKTEAKEAAKEAEYLLKNGKLEAGNTQILLKDYLNKWITEYKKDVKEGTMIVHRYNVSHYIIPHIGFSKLSNYKLKDHQEFINDLYGLGLATTTIKLINGTLHNAFKKAISLGMIETNPCNGVEFRKSVTTKEKELHYFNKDQIETFLAYAKEENEYIYYYFFLTAIYTGMRKGELMALQWNNVDFLRNTIKIDQTRLYRKEKRGQLELSTPKTESGFRTLVMSKTVKQALLELKNRQQNYLTFYAERKYPDTDFVFCFKNFNPIADRTVNGAFERISKKAKLPKIKVHDLRHTHAVLLRQAGVSLEDIQGILGHKNPTATLIYAHITEEVKQSAMDKLDSHMGTKTRSNATKMPPKQF